MPPPTITTSVLQSCRSSSPTGRLSNAARRCGRHRLGRGGETMKVEPLDATFGAVVGVELAALDDATWDGSTRPGSSTPCWSFPASSSRSTTRTPSRPLRRPRVQGGADLEHRTQRPRALRARRRRREVGAGQRGLAPRQHLHAGAGQGGRVLRRDRARGRGPRAGPTCGRRTRRSTTTPPARRWHVRLPLAVLQPGSSGLHAVEDGPTTGGYAATATTTAPSLRPLVKVHPDTGRPNL